MTPADIAWMKWRGISPEGDTQTAFHAGFAAAIEECAKVTLESGRGWNTTLTTAELASRIRALKAPQAGEVGE